MPFEVGYDGQVIWAAGYTAEVKQWGGDISADVLDGTSFDNDSGFREKKLGLEGGAGSLECNLDPTIAPPMPARTAGILTLKTQKDAPYIEYKGSAYLSAVHPVAPVEGIVTVTVDFEFTGKIEANLVPA